MATMTSFSSWLRERRPTGGPTDDALHELQELLASGRLPDNATWRDLRTALPPCRWEAAAAIWRGFEVTRSFGCREVPEPDQPTRVADQ